MTLYQLNHQFEQILEMAETGEFEEDVIRGTLECVEGEIEEKLDSYGVVVNELQADIDKVDAELKRLQARKKTLTGSVDYLKRNVMETLRRMDKRSVKGERFTWSIAKNGGKAPLIIDEGVSAISMPEKYQTWDCTVSIWDDGKKQWIEKEDTGTESNTEKAKGLASDSFKRACFNWGIGRELYTAPDMFVFKSDLKTFNQSGDKCTCFDKFTVTDLEYEGRTICRVVIRNDSNGKIISFGESRPTQPAQPTAPTPRAVTQADKDKLKAWADKNGMNMSIVMTMAGVETMDGLTAEGYNAMAKVLREM